VTGASFEGADQEMGDPALVLGAELARAVDAAHAQHRGRQAEGPGVVEHVLVGRALGAAVGGGEVESGGLVDAVAAQGRVLGRVAAGGEAGRHAGEAAVDLVGAGEDERRAGRLGAQGLENVEGAAGVHLEVLGGVGEAVGHRDLTCEVEDGGGDGDGVGDGVAVAHVGGLGDDAGAVAVAQPVEVLRDAGAAEVVEDDDLAALRQQRVGEVRADEARAPGDQDGIGRPRAAGAGDRDLAAHRLRPAFAQQAGEQLLAAVHVAQAHEVVADVELAALLHGRVARQVGERVPVEPLGRRIERVEEAAGLLDLVVAPGRVARFGDPDLDAGAVAVEQGAGLGDVVLPAAPGAGLAVPGAGKAVDRDGGDLLEHPALAHQLQPVEVERARARRARRGSRAPRPSAPRRRSSR
jgi:hypothetical protein